MAKEIDNKYTLNEWHFVISSMKKGPPEPAKLYFLMPLEYRKDRYLKLALYGIDRQEIHIAEAKSEVEVKELLDEIDLAMPETLFEEWLEEAAEEFQESKTSNRYGPAFIRFVFRMLTNS